MSRAEEKEFPAENHSHLYDPKETKHRIQTLHQAEEVPVEFKVNENAAKKGQKKVRRKVKYTPRNGICIQ